jgi:hypothetical protein
MTDKEKSRDLLSDSTTLVVPFPLHTLCLLEAESGRWSTSLKSPGHVQPMFTFYAKQSPRIHQLTHPTCLLTRIATQLRTI